MKLKPMTKEERLKAAVWHENRAEMFEKWSTRELWTEDYRKTFAEAAEVERRIVQDYRTGQIKWTIRQLLWQVCHMS